MILRQLALLVVVPLLCRFSGVPRSAAAHPVERLPQATTLLAHDRGAWTEGLVCSLSDGGVALRVWESTGLWTQSRLVRYSARLNPRPVEGPQRPRAVNVEASVRLLKSCFGEGLAARPADGLLYQGTYTSGDVLRWEPGGSLAGRGTLRHPFFPPRRVPGSSLLRSTSDPDEERGDDGPDLEVSPFASLDTWLRPSTNDGRGREVWGLAWAAATDVLFVSNGTLDIETLHVVGDGASENGSVGGGGGPRLEVTGTLRIHGARRSDAWEACRAQQDDVEEGRGGGDAASREPWWPLRLNELEFLSPAALSAIQLLRAPSARSAATKGPPSLRQELPRCAEGAAELWAAVYGCSRGVLRADPCTGTVIGWLRFPADDWAPEPESGLSGARFARGGDLNGIAVCSAEDARGGHTATALLVTGKGWSAVHAWHLSGATPGGRVTSASRP